MVNGSKTVLTQSFVKLIVTLKGERYVYASSFIGPAMYTVMLELSKLVSEVKIVTF